MNKAKSATDLADCATIIFHWTKFFRSGHIGFQDFQYVPDEKILEEKREQYKNAEKLDVNLADFQDYLKNKKEIDYEGIWKEENFTVGIKKIGNEYIGFITDVDSVNYGNYWYKNQIKFRIKKDNTVEYYTREHAKISFSSANLMGNNFLNFGFVHLLRANQSLDTEIKLYLERLYTNKPLFEKLNNKTLYLRIPSFEHSNKRLIDSLINTHKKEILQTENLIIDLRNNGGGSDNSYAELLPIIYTNPIRTVGVEMLSTELNNRRMLEYSQNKEFDKEFRDFAKKAYEKLSKHIGEFVNLEDSIVTTYTRDTIYKYPKKIGVIINENNASSTEQFLLEAKQSRKVKLYGTTTMGVLDISNMYFVKSPCGEFEFGYGLSRSNRMPQMSIDEKGIQPDFYINQTIPKHKWIEFVEKQLNE